MFRRLGAFLLIGWAALKPILEAGEHVEFLHARFHDILQSKSAMGFIVNPPSWISLIVLLAGLGFLYWDDRRRTRSAASPHRVYEVGKRDSIPLAPPTPAGQRIPLVQLYKSAESHGIHLVGGQHSIVKFTQGIRQAAADGALKMWGRQHRHMFENLNRNEVLVPIPLEHWIKFQPEWVAIAILDPSGGALLGFNEDNFLFRSYIPGLGGIGGYNDLHAERSDASRWIESVSPETLGSAPTSLTVAPLPPKTLKSHFESDFPHGAIMRDLTMTMSDGSSLVVLGRIWMDHTSNTKFLGFYVPHTSDPFAVTAALAQDFKLLLTPSPAQMVTQNPGEATFNDSKNLRFSGRVFVYHEDLLTLQQLGQLEGMFNAESVIPQFRGHQWVAGRMLQDRANPP